METENKAFASNKIAVMHVLAGLIQNPLLFTNDKYRFTIEDFPEQFHRILFGAIDTLARNGMEKISYIDIDQLLKNYPVQYKVFCDNNGIMYIQNILKMYDEKKFEYYYNTLRKYSLINKLNEEGIKTSDIYDPDIIDPVKTAEMYDRFDNMSVNDILDNVDAKLIGLKQNYISNSDIVENRAGDGLKALKERLKQKPDVGLSLFSPKLTTILRGQRRGCLFIESAPSGYGKALPNSSRLPTPDGWKTVGDIKVGDYLFDGFGHPTKVTDIFPQGKKEVYKITFRDGRTVRCCNEHLWSYCTEGQRKESKTNRIFYTRSLQEIIDNVPLKNNGNAWNVLVPQQRAVEYPEKQHFIPSYILGLALGNGCFREQIKNKSFYFSSDDKETVESIAKTMGWKIKKQKSTYSWYFATDKGLSDNNKENIWVSDFLKEIPGLINTTSHTKFIPREYLEDSIEHRWDLLNGLLDTDGSVSLDKGRVSFFTVSEKLRDNFIELARSLGFIISVHEDHHKKTSVCYQITLMGSPELKKNLFKLPRKHNRIIKYLDKIKNQKRIYKYEFNPIVSIEKLNYEEEMTCFMVDNDEHLFLTDDFVVTHNSRRANGEACHLAIPEYYDVVKQQWVHTGMQQKVLVISTELEEFECQQMWMACIAGVPEDHIKDGRYKPGEEERVDKAIALIEKSNLFFVSITNFDADDIKNIIKKYHQVEKVDYVYFDYLGESLKITATASRQSGVKNLRTDQILLMFASQLKDLAKTLNIYIWTATQLSGDYKNAKQLDASYLRSAKSISDKCDAGYILMPVNPEVDQPIIDTWCTKGFEIIPNFYLSIYKVRAGSYQNIKVWVYFDRSTCQMTDCFVTNNRNEIIDVEDTIIEMILDDTKEINFANALNSAVNYTNTSDSEDDDSEFNFEY